MGLESWPVGTEGTQCAVLLLCRFVCGAPDAGPAHCSLPYISPRRGASGVCGSEPRRDLSSMAGFVCTL